MHLKMREAGLEALERRWSLLKLLLRFQAVQFRWLQFLVVKCWTAPIGDFGDEFDYDDPLCFGVGDDAVR
jgi:hypothetical protein